MMYSNKESAAVTNECFNKSVNYRHFIGFDPRGNYCIKKLKNGNCHPMFTCPACPRICHDEETCFEHLLNHFEGSQYLLFRRCALIAWLKTFIDELKNRPISRITEKNNRYDMNTDRDNLMINFNCELCGKNYFSLIQLSVHSISHMKLVVPKLDFLLKCPLCDKYFSKKQSSFEHLFTHFLLNNICKRFSIIIWLSKFFSSVKGVETVQVYNFYATKLKLPKFSKILVSEVRAIKSCFVCKKSVSTIFDFLENHSNCKGLPSRVVYCALCDFKTEDVNALTTHFFLNHVNCYCGNKGTDFSSFLKHSANCQVYENGVLCPICRDNQFVSVSAFKKHIEDAASESCAVALKSINWKCLLCKKQQTQYNIYQHIFTKHISCLCGLKFEDFRSFCFHTNKCSSRKGAIICPICEKMLCCSEEIFKNHILSCSPPGEKCTC